MPFASATGIKTDSALLRGYSTSSYLLSRWHSMNGGPGRQALLTSSGTGGVLMSASCKEGRGGRGDEIVNGREANRMSE